MNNLGGKSFNCPIEVMIGVIGGTLLTPAKPRTLLHADQLPTPLPCRARRHRASGYKLRRGQAITAIRIVVRIDWTGYRYTLKQN